MRLKSPRYLPPALAVLLVAAAPAGAEPPVVLVESAPVETPLNAPGVPDAKDVWPEMIDGAASFLDFAEFYVSPSPGGDDALGPVLDAVKRAAARGVAVRFLADRGFYDTYPETLDELSRTPGIAVRLVDFRAIAGGPMHAKYFLVDGEACYVGSQNFDWRALEHIHEMGARIRVQPYVQALGAVFEMDWVRAEPLGNAPREAGTMRYAALPGAAEPVRWVTDAGDSVVFRAAFSPQGQLVDEAAWDLPQILDLMRGARDSLSATVLTYDPRSRDDGTYWEVLENALRDAAVRGVRVRLMVADWSKREPRIDFLKSLQSVPGIEVRLVTVPEASEGFIPFARVIHAKYLTVDGEALWLGTSNWEKSYFTAGRNVGFVARSRELARTLDADFLRWWSSPYAYPVDPCAEYEPPKIGP